MKTAISGEGTRIAYDEPGEGPPLILVGGAFNTRSFGPNGGLDYQKGKPLPAERWASVTMPTLVAVGGKNPDWMRHAMRGSLRTYSRREAPHPGRPDAHREGGSPRTRSCRVLQELERHRTREEGDVNTGVGGNGDRETGRARIIDLSDPGYGEDANEVQGHNHSAAVSVIVVDAPPGSGPKLHRHPYEEVFVIQEGTVTLTAGDETIEANGGQVVVVPAGVAHKFVNSGTGRLRQVDIHASDRFVTEWLE